jgi:hypothetical protein
MFSLLGWETGMIIYEVWKHFKNDTANGEKIIAHLKNNPLNSPRGLMKLDDETQFYTAPVTKFYLKAGAAEAELTEGINAENEWRSFTSKPTEGMVTGWTNTYLCY